MCSISISTVVRGSDYFKSHWKSEVVGFCILDLKCRNLQPAISNSFPYGRKFRRISVVDMPPPTGRTVARTRAVETRERSSFVLPAVPSGFRHDINLNPLLI